MAGFDISQLQGTPLYQLAKNANVYGGKNPEQNRDGIFQQQCREFFRTLGQILVSSPLFMQFLQVRLLQFLPLKLY